MPRLLTLADLKRAIASYDGSVEDDSCGGERHWRTYQCISPAGKQWACCDIHAIKVEWADGEDDGSWRSKEIKDAIERIAYGLRDCPKDCECQDK